MNAHRIVLTISLIVLCTVATAADFNWSGSADSEDWYAFNPVPDTDDPVVWLNNWGEIHYQYPGQNPPGPGSWNWPSGPDSATISIAGAELTSNAAALTSMDVDPGGTFWIRNTLQCATFTIAGLVEVGAYAEIYDCAIQGDGAGVLRSEFYWNFVVPDPVLHDVIISVPVEIPNEKALALLGDVHLNDVIELISTGATAHLAIDGDVTLSGSGWVETSDNAGNTISGNQYYGQVFTNQTTIHAAGFLGYANLSITNEGLIVADRTTPLIVEPESFTGDGHPGFINTGTLRASGGGTLRFQNGTIDNTGGLIQAWNGSAVELHDHAFVTGGTLQTAGTGEIRATGTEPRVADLTVSGGSALVIPNGKHLLAEDTVTIHGELRLESAGAGSTLVVRSPVFLAGAGEVVLSDANGNSFSFAGGSAGNRLTSSVAIRGATGSVYGLAHGIAITNLSTITADGVNPLFIDPSDGPVDGQSGVINTGTLRAVGGATMQLAGGTFDNTGGVIEAQDGSTVELGAGAAVIGGILRTIGSGVLPSTSGSFSPSLTDLTVDGRVESLSGTGLRLGGTVVNNGIIESDGYVLPSGDLVLAGTGELRLTNGAEIRPDGNSVTNGSDHTIRSTGSPTSYIHHPLVHHGTLVVESGAGLRFFGTYEPHVGSSTHVDGTLQVGGTQMMPGELSGNGTVNGAVQLTGTGSVAPGSSTGTLTTGNLTIDDGATYFWQTSDATGSDLVDVNGTLDMGVATLTVTIDVLAGEIPDRVVLFAYNTLASTPSTSQFALTHGYTFTGIDTSNNELALTGVDRPDLIFANGFESGDVEGWSSSQGWTQKSMYFDPLTDSLNLRFSAPEMGYRGDRRDLAGGRTRRRRRADSRRRQPCRCTARRCALRRRLALEQVVQTSRAPPRAAVASRRGLAL